MHRMQAQMCQSLTANARRVARWAGVLGFLVALPAVASHAQTKPQPRPQPPEPLTEARRLYNEGRFDDSLAIARAAADVPNTRPGALLLVGRAALERYRLTGEQPDLDLARESLRTVDASRLDPGERVEFAIGLGETLYFDQAHGAAAEMFQGILEHEAAFGSGARDRLLDWWCGAVDRLAQAKPAAERAALYDSIVARMGQELRRDLTLAVPNYWIPAALLAKGDADAAWDAAMAGWLRAQMAAWGASETRADIDVLVQQAIVPERARKVGRTDADAEAAATALLADWATFKDRWR